MVTTTASYACKRENHHTQSLPEGVSISIDGCLASMLAALVPVSSPGS